MWFIPKQQIQKAGFKSAEKKTQNLASRMFHFWCHEHGLESNPWPSELTVRALVHWNLVVLTSPSINNFYRQCTTAISTKRIWPEKIGDVTAKLNPLFYCQLNGVCSKQRLLRSLDELIWSQISTGKELVEAGTEPLTSWSLGNRADHSNKTMASDDPILWKIFTAA